MVQKQYPAVEQYNELKIMSKMKFILSRTDDYAIHTKKWIVGYGLLFWLVSRIVAMCLVTGCVAIYNIFGLNPEEMTRFSGNPETTKTLGSGSYILLTAILVAPLLEECIFRLGLSFRKWQVALSVASIPAYMLWQHIGRLSVVSASIYIICIVTVFALIYFLTSDSFWEGLRRQYYRPTIWLSSFAFGFLHLIAFSEYSLLLLPYMLCIISIPLFGGFAITYYRINLGFWWGVGLHVFNNLPAVFIMAFV